MLSSFLFFLIASANHELYTLSLHDALPIYVTGRRRCPEDDRQRHPVDRPELRIPDGVLAGGGIHPRRAHRSPLHPDRKSTRLNSSHLVISYAVFCLKKKM